ncbi:MAG: cell division protein FtsZ [Proteobacteria bacterium]|nr:cell division protein FtsZ [Pseudomonadota bacterium]
MTLTVALAILAAVVLAAILAHSTWTARRQAPRRPRQPAPERNREHEITRPPPPDARVEPTLSQLDDALDTRPEMPFAADLSEPELPAAAELGSADDIPPVDLAEPEWADTRPPEAAAAKTPRVAPRRQRRAGPQVDALIDAIATLRPEGLISGAMLLQHLPTTHRAGGKPFYIEGLSAATGEWELPHEAARYTEVQVGLQMANRQGALNEIEFSEFVQKMQPLADGIGAEAEFPDMMDAVAQARELDAFASQHDAQLTASLRANSVAWSLAYVEQCAGRHGFVPGAVPGRLVLPGEGVGAPPLLVLSFDAQVALADDASQSALREVTLSLDVPQSPESAEPFVAWQQGARRLADDLDATLVDEQGHPITLQAFAAIGQELTRLYQALAARDLAAGSPAARRLFS